MKENAWTEIATALNTTLVECKNRWLRLRQRFSKERQLREQETRSGAQKPTRQKWVLFDSLSFLERHIPQRRSFSNVNLVKQSNSVSGTLLKNKHSIVLQNDEIFANDDSNHKTSASASGQHTLSKEISNYHTVPLAVNEETSLVSNFESHRHLRSQTPVSDRSDIVSQPLSCFSGNQQRAFKKRKFDPVETAFHQMNHTLSTMAAEVCSRKKLENNNNTDNLIGKLVTAELQAAIEPRKSELKQKFMKLLYF